MQTQIANKYIRNNLVALRTAKGINKKEMAELLDIDRQKYYSYESGRCVPGYDLLIKIVDFFGVDLRKFLTEEL